VRAQHDKVALLVGAAEGVQHLHSCGIVHADLKGSQVGPLTPCGCASHPCPLGGWLTLQQPPPRCALLALLRACAV
jgi:hypothetical protein